MVLGGAIGKEGQGFESVVQLFIFKGVGRGEVGAVRGVMGVTPCMVFLGKEQF